MMTADADLGPAGRQDDLTRIQLFKACVSVSAEAWFENTLALYTLTAGMVNS